MTTITRMGMITIMRTAITIITTVTTTITSTSTATAAYAHVGSFDRKMRALRSRAGAGQWVGALQKLRLYSR